MPHCRVGRQAVLIVDDAHRLNGSGLRELSQISGLAEDGTQLLRLFRRKPLLKPVNDRPTGDSLRAPARDSCSIPDAG